MISNFKVMTLCGEIIIFVCLTRIITEWCIICLSYRIFSDRSYILFLFFSCYKVPLFRMIFSSIYSTLHDCILYIAFTPITLKSEFLRRKFQGTQLTSYLYLSSYYLLSGLFVNQGGQKK